MEQKDGIPVCRVHQQHIWRRHEPRACRVKCEAFWQLGIPLVQFFLKLAEGSAFDGMRRLMDGVDPVDNVGSYHTYSRGR
jgi:hypothetical protein